MPREGHDPDGSSGVYDFKSFQSTCPARGTTLCDGRAQCSQEEFQSTCPARGTTKKYYQALGAAIFQSTCPARGTTPAAAASSRVRRNFNPRAPRGARQGGRGSQGRGRAISIHVPREGHDYGNTEHRISAARISIHVPREGHDISTLQRAARCCNFNPRAPRGARLYLPGVYAARGKFQSTCPARGTTSRGRCCPCPKCNFNPRAPRGARRQEERGREYYM